MEKAMAIFQKNLGSSGKNFEKKKRISFFMPNKNRCNIIEGACKKKVVGNWEML